MAKAQITLPGGTLVTVVGTPAEITAVLERLNQIPKELKRSPANPTASRFSKEKRQRVQLVDLVGSLIDGGFFKKPKDLASVRTALQEMGHHYPVTTLSGTMLQQVRKRNLRRLKQDRRWVYTG